MATLFTKIIEGEIPGRFVWRDDRAVVFLTIAPITRGHVLVVPIEEVDHWIDLDPELTSHLFRVAQTIGQAQDRALDARRIGVLIVGDEVPHVHIHVVPFDAAGELSFAKADPNPPEGSLEEAAGKIRAALRDLGADSVSE
jgi:histidine triad (HIT) family protein